MELSLLPLMLLLLLNIHPGQTQVLIEAPKPLLTTQPESSQIFRGVTVTLTCDIRGHGWTYNWECGDKQNDSEDKELKITVESEQKCRCYGCRESFCSQWSDNVTLAESGSEAPLQGLSVLKLLSFLLAASPYLLVSIILGVKYYRAHVQTYEIYQYTVTEERTSAGLIDSYQK